MGDEARVILIITALIMMGFRMYNRAQRQQGYQRPIRQPAPTRGSRVSQAPAQSKKEGISTGFSSSAETADGKFLVTTGIVMIDIKKPPEPGAVAGLAAKSEMEQTQIALPIVTDSIPAYVSTVSSTEIAADFAAFTKKLEAAMRDQLAAAGFSLGVLLLMDHSIEDA